MSFFRQTQLLPQLDKLYLGACGVTKRALQMSLQRPLSRCALTGRQLPVAPFRAPSFVERFPLFPEHRRTLTSSPTYQSPSIAGAVRSGASKTAETYVAYGITKRLYDACAKQADYTIPQMREDGRGKPEDIPMTSDGEHLGVGEGWWYDDLKLQPTFSSWSQVTFLHMYMLTVRLRALPSHDSYLTYSRHLFDHFSHNAEYRMDIYHGINMRGIRNKYLKDLFIQWRGILAAYDEGLIAGDAVLGAAIWRNIWKGKQEVDDWDKIARVVAYTRRCISQLAEMDEGDVITSIGDSGQALGNGGKKVFGPNKSDMDLVKAVSRKVQEYDQLTAGN